MQRVPKTIFVAALLAIGWSLVAASPARALNCTDLGGVVNMGECQVSASVVRTGTYDITQTLRMMPTGEIDTAGGNITINVMGDFIMEVPVSGGVGSRITADVNTSAVAGSIIVNSTGSMLLKGDGSKGGLISSEQTMGSCSMGGGGGQIALQAGGNFTMQDGSKVTVDAKCSAGDILITADLNIIIDGIVTSFGMISGVQQMRPGGGTITIIAGCDLLIDDDGIVSSRGKDPGADLVHVEGCTVTIHGLVESWGPGHQVPTNPPNHCHDPLRPDKPPNSTACVEIWSHGNLIIDGNAPFKGEVNADTGQSGGHEIAWIDIFAVGDITILGKSSGTAHTIHANQFLTNCDGGIITVKSTQGALNMTGNAVQAKCTNKGGSGGTLTFEASGTVDLDAASIDARGNDEGGGMQSGGNVDVRSFNGQVLGVAPGIINAGGGVNNNMLGSIEFRGCNNVPPAVNYTGTTIPAAVTLPPLCGGMPMLPSYAQLVACQQGGTGNITGMKQISTMGNLVPGPGWTICLDQNSNQMCEGGEPTTVTDMNGMYSFNNLPGGMYTVCEVVQPNFLPLTPICQTVVIGACAGDGIVNFINSGEPQQPPCPEDTDAMCTLFVVQVNSGDPPPVPPDYATLQEAVDVSVAGDVICVYARTTENVVINEGHAVEITQCTVAEVTAADPGLPVIQILGASPNTVLIIGLDATGGTVGFQVDGSNHELRGVRAYDNSVDGIRVNGNSNRISVNRVERNGTNGLLVVGSSNIVQTGKYSQNLIGVRINGNQNQVTGITAELNGAEGVFIGGTLNTLTSVRSRQNGDRGFTVLGNTNTLKSCEATQNTSDGFGVGANGNTLRAGESVGNGGNGFSISGAGNKVISNQGSSNGENGVWIEPGASNTAVVENKMSNDVLCEFLNEGAGTTDATKSNTANGVKFTNIEAGGCFE